MYTFISKVYNNLNHFVRRIIIFMKYMEFPMQISIMMVVVGSAFLVGGISVVNLDIYFLIKVGLIFFGVILIIGGFSSLYQINKHLLENEANQEKQRNAQRTEFLASLTRLSEAIEKLNEKLDKLMNLVGELQINRSRINELTGNLKIQGA